MSKISQLIDQIDLAKKLLGIQIEREEMRLTYEWVTRYVDVYQKVSLAEKHSQVKNTCSYMSSTIGQNLINYTQQCESTRGATVTD